jgi:hypothetical protein
MITARTTGGAAGRSSGSIEITLPVELEVLEGVECRLIMRDGPRPEIVLQPDVSPAHPLVRDLWQKLRAGMSEVAEIGEFSQGDFTLTFFSPPTWQDRPPLTYVDALVVLQEKESEGAEARHPGALARLLAGMAVAAAYRLALSGSVAVGFGESVAYIVTGTAAGLGTDFERGMAHPAFWGESRAQPMGSPFNDEVWQQARPGFRRVYDRFRAWQENPDAYAAAREQWYRALAVEVGVRVSSVGGYLEQRRSGRRP